MTAFVHPSTRIRRNRAHNVDTDRLRNRRARLIIEMRDRVHDSRQDMAVRAYELQAIENVLVRRGKLPACERYTLAGNDSGRS